MFGQIRRTDHKLNIEVGRHKGIPESKRICKFCNLQCIESEKHFLLECSTYLEPLEKLFQFFSIKVLNFAKLNIDEKFSFMLSAEDPVFVIFFLACSGM